LTRRQAIAGFPFLIAMVIRNCANSMVSSLNKSGPFGPLLRLLPYGRPSHLRPHRAGACRYPQSSSLAALARADRPIAVCATSRPTTVFAALAVCGRLQGSRRMAALAALGWAIPLRQAPAR
jgi:hypothetical protein